MVFGIEPFLPFLVAVIGVAVVGLAAVIPTDEIIVSGLALMFAGLTGFAVPFLAGPLALAGLFVIYAAITYVLYRQFVPEGSSAGQTSDADSLRGREGRVTSRIPATGKGTVSLTEGGTFTARSETNEPIEEGEEIIVLDPSGGSILGVAPMSLADGVESRRTKETEKE